ncbi:hypothetical protein FA95DRAFT_1488080 [Auriscalpium vulgare]|uniref:Uncharacterized protein n=1 Tax=Auriscalpium vulgare TaxID=40419 RepID=A0ACB8S1N9_9AGAM|nr:hypothetical protein FA95DRAFT_1488080 [Auriscalpium vulgare]
MDLAPIGAHCSLSSCSQLDLLPIRCRCDAQFCRDHIFPDRHDCPVDPSHALKQAPALEKLRRCAFVSCKKPSLEAYTSSPAEANEQPDRIAALCTRCKLGYCASHRSPMQHACPFDEPKAPLKNEAAHALLAKHFPVSTSASKPTASAKKKLPTDPKKLAQLRKIEGMKMRRSALPGDPREKASSVPVDQRLHLKVSAPEWNTVEKVVWLRKTQGTGRALDLLAEQLKVPSSDSSPIHLARVDLDEPSVLANDKTLGEQVNDGSSIIITYVSV